MGRFGTGQAIRRTEDQRFLTGRGEYTDDLNLPNQSYLYVLRSPYAHGTLNAVDTTEAKQADGIIDNPIVAVKERGRLKPDWRITRAGGEITQW